GRGFDPSRGFDMSRGTGRRDSGTGGATGRVKSVAIVVDPKANSVTITAPVEKIQLAKKLIEEMDKAPYPGAPPYKYAEPEIRKYPVPAGTAEAVAKTLVLDQPNLRIIALPASNEVLVLATAQEHFDLMAKMKAFLDGGNTTAV